MSKAGAGKRNRAQEAFEREQRAMQVWWRCRWNIRLGTGGIYSLPGEPLGAEIGERMLRTAYMEMLARSREQGRIDVVRPGDIRLASALVPS